MSPPADAFPFSSFAPMTRSVLISISVLALALASAHAQTAQTRARANSEKAALILARFEELLCPAGAGHDCRADDARRRKLADAMSQKIPTLADGDLKTDLAAALNFYTLALDADDARPARCDLERPGAYASLCARAGGDRRTLLLEKSRLRASWARASLMRERGEGVETRAAESLREAEAERASEREMAAEAVALLRRLGERVVVYDSLAEFEDGRELAKVSYERFRDELDEASARLRRIVAWLPPGPPREEIRKATQSYLDGVWWWSQTRRTNVVRVSADSFAEQTRPRPVNETTARYTVALHWRQAHHYTRRAASLLTTGY